MPKVSVITINLNNGAGLLKTIKSVINQKYVDYELIIIDGGSNDESVNIIKQFSDRIGYWVSEPDSGIYAAMNKGIRLTKGEYLIFLHSGDALINCSILDEIFFQKCSEDILYGDIQYFEPKSISTFKTCLPNKLDLFFFYQNSIWHQAAFIKKRLFEQIGSYNENNKFVSDWEFFLDAIIYNGASYRNLNRVITDYDLYNGISVLRREEALSEKVKVLKKKVSVPVLELLESMNSFKIKLESDSFKIQRWFERHPTILKSAIYTIKLTTKLRLFNTKSTKNKQ